MLYIKILQLSCLSGITQQERRQSRVIIYAFSVQFQDIVTKHTIFPKKRSQSQVKICINECYHYQIIIFRMQYKFQVSPWKDAQIYTNSCTGLWASQTLKPQGEYGSQRRIFALDRVHRKMNVMISYLSIWIDLVILHEFFHSILITQYPKHMHPICVKLLSSRSY